MTEPSPDAAAKTERRSAVGDFIPAHADEISLFPAPVVDNLMHVVIALGAEMWTMRRRMHVLEKVLEKVGVSAEDIETYQPTAAESAAWTAERDIVIARTFDALSRQGGGNRQQLDKSRIK